ncbi:uncharacterized protein LOC134275970 [Saccostrea cucullata]|uniref:uncharacterized protein LOC134275970 n=1 Tax=Saccostrea cuccullata TaxID=36930 RepID=UPI002ED08699
MHKGYTDKRIIWPIRQLKHQFHLDRPANRRLFDESSPSSSSGTSSKEPSANSLESPDISERAEEPKVSKNDTALEYQVANVTVSVYHPTDKKEIMLNRLEIQLKKRIDLSVGDRRFKTSRQTMQDDPSSILSAMVAKDLCSRSNDTKTFFLDRNPRYFDCILDYLRSSTYNSKILPYDKCILRQIHEKATYNRLTGLVHAVEERVKGKAVPLQPGLWDD